jgi:DNA polymerase-3 subunit epsilon
MQRRNNKTSVIEWAKTVISRDPLILDTETTGLDPRAEIVQIAVIDLQGRVLLDTLVKPTRQIPYDAVRIHGITDMQVSAAPGWSQVVDTLYPLLMDRDVVIYNADYDTLLLRQSSNAVSDLRSWLHTSWYCALKAYAKFYGEWNDYRNDWKWQALEMACHQQRITGIEAPAHSALGDCQRTLALLKCMAATEIVTSPAEG